MALIVPTSSDSIDATHIKGKSVDSLSLTAFSDDFAGASLDATKWQVINRNAPTTPIVSPAAPYPNIALAGGSLVTTYHAGTEFYLRSKQVFKLVDGAYVRFQGLTQVFNNSVFFGLLFRWSGTNFHNAAYFDFDDVEAKFFTVKSGVSASNTVNPLALVNREYFRIRRSGNDVLWETSADGNAWTVQKTDANSPFCDMYFYIFAQLMSDDWSLKDITTNCKDALIGYKKATDTVNTFNFTDIKLATDLIAV